MLFVTIIIAVILELFLIPFRQKDLIEGVFEKEENTVSLNFSSTRVKAFYFKNYCKSCFENWRKTGKETRSLYGKCVEIVPRRALNLSGVSPKNGDIIKIVVWKTIFGKIRAYKITPSDYVWTNPYDIKLRLEAEARGFSDVNEYKRNLEQEWREKFLQETMKKHGLAREEAEMLEILPLFLYSMEKEAKRRGISIVEVEKEFYEKVTKSEHTNPDCLKIDPFYIAKIFLQNNSIPQDVLNHLNGCSDCNLSFTLHARNEQEKNALSTAGLRNYFDIFLEEGANRLGITPEEYEKKWQEKLILYYGGNDCFTLKERIIYVREGNIPSERLGHTENCPGCKRMMDKDREDFLTTGKIGGLALKEWRESRNATKNRPS